MDNNENKRKAEYVADEVMLTFDTMTGNIEMDVLESYRRVKIIISQTQANMIASSFKKLPNVRKLGTIERRISI